MPRRSEHSLDEIRALALDAVEDLVASHGPTAISARKVAAQIGYTVGMLYHVFDNVDDLVLQANARLVDQLARANEAAAAGNRPQRVIARMAHNYLSLARQAPARWQLVFVHTMRDGRPVPDWYRQRTDRLFALVEEQLQRLAPRRRPAAAALAARTLWSSVHGICLLAVSDKLDIGGSTSAEKALDSLLTHYLGSWAQSR
ncbi:MAG: WHG domain-containing protein [Alcanivoracaceae bacterium]|jgi:AcrR family transcriptional regulator|nr:WHG domain-containing protein [Alcanivoracaceae bacterium]